MLRFICFIFCPGAPCFCPIYWWLNIYSSSGSPSALGHQVQRYRGCCGDPAVKHPVRLTDGTARAHRDTECRHGKEHCPLARVLSRGVKPPLWAFWLSSYYQASRHFPCAGVSSGRGALEVGAALRPPPRDLPGTRRDGEDQRKNTQL